MFFRESEPATIPEEEVRGGLPRRARSGGGAARPEGGRRGRARGRREPHATAQPRNRPPRITDQEEAAAVVAESGLSANAENQEFVDG